MGPAILEEQGAKVDNFWDLAEYAEGDNSGGDDESDFIQQGQTGHLLGFLITGKIKRPELWDVVR